VPLRRSNVDADQIIPAVYLKRVTKIGFEDGLFAAWRKDESFILNHPGYAAGSVLVAGADFGTGSSAIDLPTLVHGAGATWLPTLLGVVALLIMLPVAGLLRHSLNASRSAERAVQTVLEDGAAVLRVAEDAGFRAADEASRSTPVAVAADSVDPDGEGRSGDAFPLALLRAAHESGFRPVNHILSSSASSEATVTGDSDGEAQTVRWTSQVAALVRVTLGSNPDGKRLPQVTGKRLADMVGAQLGGLRETAVVMSDDAGDVVMLLPGADDQRADELVHQLEDTARRQFRRSLKSVVLALEAPGQTAEQPETSDLETQLEGRPVGTRVSSPEVRGGS